MQYLIPQIQQLRSSTLSTSSLKSYPFEAMFSQVLRGWLLIAMPLVPGLTSIWPDLGDAASTATALADSVSMEFGTLSTDQVPIALQPSLDGALAGVVQTEQTIPNQFIIYLNPGVNRAAHMTKVQALIAEGIKIDHMTSVITLDGPVVAQLSMYGGVFGPSVVAGIKKLSDVKSVVADTVLEVESPLPCVPLGSVKTQDTTQTNTWNLARLNTGVQSVLAVFGPESPLRNRNTYTWPFTFLPNAGKGVNVYLIDTGVNDHVDLAGRIIRKANSNVYPTTPKEQRGDTTAATNQADAGHGTHMAGVIAGTTFGVAKYANIIPIKAANDEGQLSRMGVMAGLIFALTDSNGKGGVINLSIAMPKQPEAGTDGLLNIIQSTIAEGMHVVTGAGNGFRNVGPGINDCARLIADPEGPITAGASEIGDIKWARSNFGPCVTVFAPGHEIPTTGHETPTRIVSTSGTSEATAHITGLVATLLSTGRKFTPAQMKAEVLRLSVQVPTIVAVGTTNHLIQVPTA
ncbi:peptidase S8/S53 domain-containing protein [Mycena epipterygia]|nr:peptidase S8/S53 domain-containing protein [Mycena epipterygia]